MFDAAGGRGKPRVGQVAVSLRPGPGRGRRAGARAVPLVRARLEGQRGPARPGLLRGSDAVRHPGPGGRAAVLRTGREEHVDKIRPFIDAGFTEIALVQIGGAHQEEFIGWAERELLPALRSL